MGVTSGFSPAAVMGLSLFISVVEPDRQEHQRYAELVPHYTATYESLKEASRRRVEAG